jgi:hypothetical protein
LGATGAPSKFAAVVNEGILAQASLLAARWRSTGKEGVKATLIQDPLKNSAFISA